MQENRIQAEQTVVWREIASQAQTVEVTVRKMREGASELARMLKDCANIRFLGCGSSYHAAIMAAQVFNRIVERGEASAIVCSDFIIYPDWHLRHSGKEDLFVLISRTGRTTEILIAEEILRKRGLFRLAVTTFPDSDLARRATSSIDLTEAQEQSVTATRSVTSTTVALLALVALAKGERSFHEQLLETHAGFFRGFQEYCTVMSGIVNGHDFRKFVFLGSGPFYGLAKEAELKVKEMSQTEAESNQPLEFRHGYKSLLDERTLVVLFPTSEGLQYESGSMSQLHRQGAKLLLVSGRDEAGQFEGLPDFRIVPEVRLTERPRLVYYQLFGQLAGFYQARKKGIDPSNPRNHEYCVTF